ncbi:MAG: hypothetical protein MUC50_05810 [Myxococcota bacterium]|jgi:hypothetical protein|nr:hypothetical protein [Myxococcota bacterium]
MSTPRKTEDDLRALFAARDERTPIPPLSEVWQRAQDETAQRRKGGAARWRFAVALGGAAVLVAFWVLWSPQGDDEPRRAQPDAELVAASKTKAASGLESLQELGDEWNDASGLGLTEPSSSAYAMVDLGSGGYGLSVLEMDGPTDFLLDWDIPAWADNKRSTL